MRTLRRILSSFGLMIFVVTAGLLAWFVPWVFSLQLGVLVYFPYEPDGTSRYMRVTGPLWNPISHDWVDSESIPKACKNALVAAEDTRFYQHFGVDIESLEKNYDRNKHTKHKRGGSTLTQQLVKNAFLSRDRSYVRKVRELAGALLLDATTSKDNQLTWYLNIVEFGPHTYGLSAAAKKYFKKDAKNLSVKECISLVAILPSPNKWNRSLVTKNYSGFLTSRMNVIESRMRIMGNLSGARVVRNERTEPDKKEVFPMDLELPKLPDPLLEDEENEGPQVNSQNDDVIEMLDDDNDANDNVDDTDPQL